MAHPGSAAGCSLNRASRCTSVRVAWHSRRVPLLISQRASDSCNAAIAWLVADPTPAWIVGASRHAAATLRLRAVEAFGRAALGWEVGSLRSFSVRGALPQLASVGQRPAQGLALHALAARALHEMDSAALGRYAPIAKLPGTAGAVARVRDELRLSGGSSEDLRSVDPALAAIVGHVEGLRATAKLADTTDILQAAAKAPPQARLLLLDLSPKWSAELALLRAWIAACDPASCFATMAAGDPAIAALSGAYQDVQRMPVAEKAAVGLTTLASVQQRLFVEASETTELTVADANPSEVADTNSAEGVEIFDAPEEARECVEVARRIQQAAAQGVRYDQVAVLLRQPEVYRAPLVEALKRAEIPARFQRGTVLPDPAGRALLALLDCRAQHYSARAFGEYLSLGVIPGVIPEGISEIAPGREAGSRHWSVASDLGRDALVDEVCAQTPPTAVEAIDLQVDQVAGTLRVPEFWESLLVDAAVIGGRDRWNKRLSALERQLEFSISLSNDDDPRRRSLQDKANALARLRRFALPILDLLAALPERAPWRDWLPALDTLAHRALREPASVIEVLAELRPMESVGPVDLAEVQLVLGRRLLELTVRPTRADTGVFVGTVDDAAGHAFEVVLIPGMAERLFPPHLVQDPLLPDQKRRALKALNLPTRLHHAEQERQRLRVACRAARKQLFVSWPSADAARGRPRVPSFYALEIERAARGRLPSFAELKKRARLASSTVLGWPAPDDPMVAIDEAEFDLAWIRSLARQPQPGGAAYLLAANSHLPRALKRRARRWNTPKWTHSDGLIFADSQADSAASRLARYRPEQKAFSATALQRFAVCPYQAALYSVFGLAPREEPEPVEDLNPLQRGSLIHDIQFHLLSRLRTERQLPLDHPQRLAYARAVLRETVSTIADRHAEILAPAIDRVWQDAIADITADLDEWLGRMHEQADWEPIYFELAFGLPADQDQERDPESVAEPLQLDVGVRIRGSIDLVERQGKMLRATDYKTGRVPRYVERGLVLSGGRALQPLFYALALEKLFPEALVTGGRLYYCTTRGGFDVRDVSLNDDTRQRAADFVALVDRYVEAGFFPAAPIEDGCKYCDYAPVCGPAESIRVARKDSRRLEPLTQIRNQR